MYQVEKISFWEEKKEIIMKRLFIILLVFNSVLFSQWEEAKIYPFSGQITGFHVTDSLNITAVYYGDSSAVIRSSDGGRSWSLIAPTPVGYASQVSFVTKDTFFIGASYPVATYKTFDGGLTWTEAIMPPGYVISEICIFSIQNLGTPY